MNAEVQRHLRLFWGRGDAARQAYEREYAEILRQYGAGLSRLTSSYESDLHAREDLMQDIRLAIWLALPKFRGSSSIRTFVFRIAHNRALAHVWRRRGAAPSEHLDELEIAAKGDGPDGAAIGKLDSERLHAAIRSLPDPLKQVITLALEEISHREIAEILGTTENNVAVRLTRARGLLRQRLGGMQ